MPTQEQKPELTKSLREIASLRSGVIGRNRDKNVTAVYKIICIIGKLNLPLDDLSKKIRIKASTLDNWLNGKDSWGNRWPCLLKLLYPDGVNPNIKTFQKEKIKIKKLKSGVKIITTTITIKEETISKNSPRYQTFAGENKNAIS